MFEEVVLLGNTECKIDLATRTGKPIPNLVELMPGQREIGAFDRYVGKHGTHWEPRTRATGVYNCAGMVWASRRTSILDPRTWEWIIQEDGYRWLPAEQLPMPGDIAIYFDLDANEPYHVARVASLRKGIEGGAMVPWVISKWNSTSGESIHCVYDVPFAKTECGSVKYEIRYVTDRYLEK